MTDIYFSTDRLSVGYDGKALIKDICLSIKRGEIVTLIGPNGSGKSTILKSITRQLTIISGNVSIGGKALADISYRQLAQQLAVVLTDRLRPEMMTCRDIVATGRYPYTGRLGLLSKEDDAKVSKALHLVRASDLADRDFGAISDGQRQRVLLARAICQEPEIIVLDEPTSYLDIRHKLELLHILRDMAKEKGITVIMSLHEIDLAQRISDRVICVKGETIARFGTPDEVFREETIRELYELPERAYDPLFGSIELPRAEGDPEVFVLSSCGTGIPVYRSLQRQNIAFSAGILYTNDIDHRVAAQLAVRVIEQEPFTTLTERSIDAAVSEIDRCKRVINAGITIGDCNRAMARLIAYAKEQGKLETI